MPTDETRSADATNASQSAAETRLKSTPSSSSVAQRVGNWFWRGDELRARKRSKSPAGETLRQRAHLAADVARRLEDSPEPFDGNVEAILCDLYRQSIHWSRCALSEADSGATAPAAWGELGVEQPGPPSVKPESVQRLRAAVESGSFERFPELPETERPVLLTELRQLALSLLITVEADKRALARLRSQRAFRFGLVAAAVALSVAGALLVSRLAEASHDLARGKPWRASSTYSGAAACSSPQQECDEQPEFFFHTDDENRPWLEIDLGSPQAFSSVRIENRKDCCSERAFPLSVEVSSDRHSWRKVARRDEPFSSWLAKFPTVTERYVRVHLEKRESLHLQRVRVLR